MRKCCKIFVLQELKESVHVLLTAKIAVYLMTFLIVTVAWAAHIRWVIAAVVPVCTLLKCFQMNRGRWNRMSTARATE